MAAANPVSGAPLARRQVLTGAALLGAMLGVPASVLALPETPATARMTQLLSVVSEIVIPATKTPGGAATGTGEFVLLALAHGLEGTGAPVEASPLVAAWRSAEGKLDHAAWLAGTLDTRAGGSFLTQPPARQTALVAALDAEAYARDAGAHPWRRIKALILTGYYTSEAGGSTELQYELVPGRWDPDLPLAPGTAAWSSDWTAVDFG